jgi:hypothetical protein
MTDEFMELYGEWGRDIDGNPLPCTVEPCLGKGASGPKYGAPVSHPGLPRMGQSRIIRATDGTERSSPTALYAPKSIAADFPLLSRVSLGSGPLVTVEGISEGDMDGLFAFVRLDLV